jgi:CheY-like chemotaxis protein
VYLGRSDFDQCSEICQNQHILVVDDENDARNLMVAVLTEAGYRVRDLRSAVGLTEVACSSRPDLIVLDLTMPEVDGFTALASLKSNPVTAYIPVVIASAKAQREILIQARDLGAGDFIVKPWEDGEVEWRLANILGLVENAA